MLQFLVPSKVRRRLLSLLWAERQTGSLTELADRAGVAFAGVHAEIRGMQRSQLVVTRREAGRDVYAANLQHPKAKALLMLVSAEGAPPAHAGDDALKRKLVGLGAPLAGVKPSAVSAPKRMATLVDAVRLARRDPTVARCLPIVVWHLRDALDLRSLGLRAEEKHALGFFLELAGELGGDRRLAGLAERLRDGRMTSERDFFQRGRRETTRAFPLAAKWGFRMNMDLDSFRSLFDKSIQ